MILTKKIEVKRLYAYTKKNGWFLIIANLLAIGLAAFIDPSYFKALSLPASIIGTALAFLIGFRNNKAYDRWWEARKIWGKLVNDSRYFGLKVISYINNDNEDSIIHKRLIYRHIAYVWSINKHLRKIEWEDTISPFLQKAEFEELKTKQHIPYALLSEQTTDIKSLFNKQSLSDYKHVSLINIMENFNDALGKSERIKNTVFPMQYNWYMQYALWVFLLILPFTLIEQFGYWSFPISMAVGYIFILLEYLGRQIENPFENHPSDTAMDSLSRTIEINLKEVLGETNLPEKIKPREGKFLY